VRIFVRSIVETNKGVTAVKRNLLTAVILWKMERPITLKMQRKSGIFGCLSW
jgi:hypothetical protein